MLLYGKADIADAVAAHHLLYAHVKALLGYINKLLCLGADLAHAKGIGVVAVKAVFLYSAVNRNNVAVLQGLAGGNAVHHRFVDGNAKRSWKVGSTARAFVAFKGR